MFHLRIAKASDFDKAKKFIHKLFPDAAVSINDGDILIMAESKGRMVGFAHLMETKGRLVLQGIGVEEKWRSRGVGTSLLERVLSIASDEGRPVYLKVKSMNPAVNFYAKHGFFLKKFGDTQVLVKKPNS